MGTTQAIGFADAVAEGLTSLDAALHYQIYTNHFPPPPPGWVPLCIQAIDLVNQEDGDQTVDISDVGAHRQHGTQVPANVIVDTWHLWPFVEAATLSYDEEV